MHKIKNLLLYCFCFSIYSADPQKNFIDSLNERPFYIVTITRETPEDADYPQLTQEQKIFIFNVVNHIFSLPNELSSILSDYVDNKRLLLEEYLRIENSHLEEFQPLIECTNSSSIAVLRKYLSRKVDFSFFFDFLFTTQEFLSGCAVIGDLSTVIPVVMERFPKEIAALVPPNKKSLYVVGESLKKNTKGALILQKNILDFINTATISIYFEEDLQSLIKPHLSHYYEEAIYLDSALKSNADFFNIMHQENVNLIKQLIKVAAQIRDSNCLVVFNEMFFGKAKSQNYSKKRNYAPLSREELGDISQFFISLTQQLPQTIFYINFLHSVLPSILGKQFVERFQSLKKSWAHVSSHGHFEASDIQDTEEFLKRLMPETTYNTFANETLIYAQGQVVGKYRKMTYKDEADALLQGAMQGQESGSLYLFGNGSEDTLAENSVQQWISTSTCFDLKLGVRRTLNTYPPDGKIHVITSNTLSFPLTNTRPEVKENFSHFPEGIPFILHVDPHEQELFLRISPKRSFFLDKHQVKQTSHDIYQEAYPANLISHEPRMEIKFGISDSVFTLKIFDMRAALSKLRFYNS